MTRPKTDDVLAILLMVVLLATIAIVVFNR